MAPFPVYEMFPYRVKLDAENQDIYLDRKKVQCMRRAICLRRWGYHGWVTLIDEAERMGRLGKKARLNAYRNMAEFLLPERCLENTFSIFALSASYVEDSGNAANRKEYERLIEELSSVLPEDDIAIEEAAFMSVDEILREKH